MKIRLVGKDLRERAPLGETSGGPKTLAVKAPRITSPLEEALGIA
jgi:hypothetical protein